VYLGVWRSLPGYGVQQIKEFDINRLDSTGSEITEKVVDGFQFAFKVFAATPIAGPKPFTRMGVIKTKPALTFHQSGETGFLKYWKHKTGGNHHTGFEKHPSITFRVLQNP
jgi:hypothetical protein